MLHRDKFELDVETGCWVWTASKAPNGYGKCWDGHKQWWAHRYFYYARYGFAPRYLDHICRNKACVNPEHLRPSNHRLNAQNIAARGHADSKSRFRGVDFSKNEGKWRARARVNGVDHALGYYETEEEAGQVAAAFRAEHMPYSPEAA